MMQKEKDLKSGFASINDKNCSQIVTDQVQSESLSEHTEEYHSSEEHKIPQTDNSCSPDQQLEDHQEYSSITATRTEQSLSDCECDSTQFDVTTSFEGINPGNQGLPSNCRFTSNLQYQQAAAGFFTQAIPPPQAQVPLPVIAIPHYNTQLPFPDKSGNLPQLAYGCNSLMVNAVPMPSFSPPSTYPTVYVSPAGLITVLLKYDVAVELTVERHIRVVNHRHKAVAATNSRGSTNCVYHVAAKIFQDGTKTEVEVFGERRARMQVDGVLFSSGMEAYLFDENHVVPSYFCFNDMSKDSSVNILFQPGWEFSNDTLCKCEEIIKHSRYFYHRDGATTVIVNNIKIHQDELGEVQVISGPKFISTSPIYGSIYLQTHFVEISVQVNWNVVVKRGINKLYATYTNFTVSNGEHEAGFNQYREVFTRPHNSMITDFENWLPSLTFLCQGIPQSKTSRSIQSNKTNREKNRAGGDQLSEGY